MIAAALSMDAVSFGRRLRELREAKGLSRQDLADATGISVHTIISWEQGRFEPLISVAPQLADALDVSIDTLFADPETKTRKPFKRGRPKKPPADD